MFTQGDPLRLYDRVHAPALILYDEDAYTRFGALRAFLQDHENFHVMRIPHTRGLPHLEAPDRTESALMAFWNRFDSATAEKHAG